MPKTITVEKTLYTFDELSAEAQYRAGDDLAGDMFCDEFTEYATYEVKSCGLQSSDFAVYYSLNDCQGDGLDICGDFFIPELLDAAGVEKSAINPNARNADGFFTHMGDNIYCSCTWGDSDEDELSYQLMTDDQYWSNETNETAQYASKKVVKFMRELCSRLEQEGYDLIDFYHTNADRHEGRLYTADGKFYCYDWEV